jgi:asparagine synthase (glutamine-hydrolysing)
MGDYLVVARPALDETAHGLSLQLKDQARTEGWRVRDLNAYAWLADHGPGALMTRDVGAWTLIGDVFNRNAPVLPHTVAHDPWAYERKLIARFWGRFIGISFRPDHQLAALLRDPSGARECVAWTGGGLNFVSSSAPDWLIRQLRPAWRIDVGRLATTLHDPVAATGPLLLDGPLALEPGTLQPFPLERPSVILWRPTDIARRSLLRPPSIDDAALGLRKAIDEAVGGLRSLPGPIAAEVSGGLDSSIVAASLVRSDADSIKLWINACGSTPEADERSYVEALGEKLGFEPLLAPHATGAMSAKGLEGASQDFRPGLNGLDQAHDADWADRLTRAGVAAVMTGKGGDSILLQRATPAVFADLWNARGWLALGSSDVHELAAANECSIWSMISLAMRHRRRGHVWPVRNHPLLSAPSTLPIVHPWLADCEAFGPAKALQIAGVADSVSRHGPSMLTRAVDVRHPLCAQPVVEACLALPTSLLTTGGRDRGLARRAFQDRLPPQILNRRSKGDMTSIYGRIIFDNLKVLRPWLLEGRLAALGVIDRVGAEQQLTHEALLWRGGYSTIMVAAAYEGWVRAWEGRLGPASRRLGEPRASWKANP